MMSFCRVFSDQLESQEKILTANAVKRLYYIPTFLTTWFMVGFLALLGFLDLLGFIELLDLLS